MAMALSPSCQESRWACSTSSTVTSWGMLIVLEIAPVMNGCTAAMALMWPVWWMKRVP